MQLIDLVFRERPGYQDMYLRPFSANATPELINRLAEDTRGGDDLTPASLSRTAGQIIRPASNIGETAIIASGWSEPRLMFLATVMMRKTQSTVVTLEISGYTDYMGVHRGIRGVSIDPELRLYFNSVTEIARHKFDRPGSGTGWMSRINNSNHFITSQVLPDFSLGNSGTQIMRPEDVFHVAPQSLLQDSFSQRVAKETNYQDMRTTLTSRQPRFSNRMNDSSTRYLHRSISALATANEGHDYSPVHDLDRDVPSIMMDARAQVREHTVSSNPFFSELSRDTRILDQGFVTFGELAELNPDFNFDDVKIYFMDPKLARAMENTSGWRGGDNTTIAATQIARALPTYMTLHQISYIEFDADNLGGMDETVILIPQCLPIIGERISMQALDRFEQRLKTELFVDMLPWEDCAFSLQVRASLGADIEIKLQITGEDPGDFIFPVFCDSLVAPVLTDRRDDVEAMGSTIADIVDSLATDEMTPEPIYTGGEDDFPRANNRFNF